MKLQMDGRMDKATNRPAITAKNMNDKKNINLFKTRKTSKYKTKMLIFQKKL
jgi:hypothetical protein